MKTPRKTLRNAALVSLPGLASGWRQVRRRVWILSALCLVCSAIRPLSYSGAQPDERGEGGFGDDRDRQPRNEKVLLHHVQGLLTEGMASRFERDVPARLEKYPNAEGFFVFFYIDSRGAADGALDPAIDMARVIHDLGREGVITVAYIKSDAQASNGATLLALACHRLVMEKGGRIGYLDDSETRLRDERPGDARRARSELAVYATSRKREYPPELAESLVSKHHQNVYEVGFTQFDGNSKKKKTRLLSQERLDNLTPEEQASRIKEDQTTVIATGKRLSLTAQRARDLSVSSFTVLDRDDAFLRLGIKVGKEDVIDQHQGRLKPTSVAGQQIVDFLNHPFVRSILLLAAFLLLMVEFKMPGTLVPLLSSIGCFLVFFGSGFFAVSGTVEPTTQIYELVLFFVGLGLIATEVFVLPGVMFFGFLGVTVVLISIVLAMVSPGSSGEGLGLKGALFVLSMSLGSAFGGFLLVLRFLPTTSFFNRSGVVTHATLKGVPTADSVLEAQEEAAAFLGKVGVAITPLRPGGKIEIDGEVLDVVAEGEFVGRGEKVKVIESTAFRAVVERAE